MNNEHTIETDDEYVKLWEPETTSNTLFVTHITPTSATRYQFQTPPQQPETCTFTNGDGITPPRIVVQILNDAGYTVTNIPNLSEQDPAKKAKQVKEAIDWLKKHGGFTPGDLRLFAYRRAQNAISIVPLSNLFLEVLDAEEYGQHLQTVLTTAQRNGLDLTIEDLSDPNTHTIEVLQKLLINMRESLPLETQEQLIDIAQDRDHIVVSSSSEPTDHDMNNWAGETGEASHIQFDSEALEVLKEEGWMGETE